MATEKAAPRAMVLDRDAGVRAGEGVLLEGGAGGGWSVGLERLRGGRQEGVELLTVDNGCLSFSVIPTRGMGIRDAHCDGLRLGWDSPAGEVVHPAWVNLADRQGLGWLEGFSEWFVRCGLVSNGAPWAGGPLHGRVANRPAEQVSVSAGPPAAGEEPGEGPVIRVHGRVREACLFHGTLLLETTISTAPGAAWVRVEDRVRNLGASPQNMQMLYHVNYGPPLLEEGARLRAPVARMCPRDPGYAAARRRAWDRYRGPTAGLAEEAYYFSLKADRRGRTRVLLQNAAGDRGALQEFRVRDLPCFTLWKNEAALPDGYVTGLEPGTNYPNPYPFEEQHQRRVRLGPGRSWTAALTLRALTSRSAVRRAAREIRALQGDDPPEILPAPDPGRAPVSDPSA